MRWLTYLLNLVVLNPMLLTLGMGDKDDSEESAENEDTESNADEDTESDDSGNEDSEENEDESDSEDEEEDAEHAAAKMLFTDPKNLPKELVPAFKAMQAKFTKKMQGVASVRKQAKAWNQIVARPDFQDWFKAALAKENGDTSSESNGTTKPDSDTLATMMRKIVADELAPFKQDIAARKQREVVDKQAAEKRNLSKDFPQWENYQDGIDEVMEEYGNRITLKHAFMIAAFGDAMKVGGKKVGDLMKLKKLANGNKPTSGNRDVQSPPKFAKSVKEAAELAAKELGFKF